MLQIPMQPDRSAAAGGGAPVLSVRDLATYFALEEGAVRAVDGVSFDLYAGRTLGIVGESGCGKSITARSIMRMVERPGHIAGGEIWLRQKSGEVVDLVKLPADGPQMRSIRGSDIGLVFQEPMSSLSPVHTIGQQLIEAIRLHFPLTKQQARERAVELLDRVGIPRPDRRIDDYTFQLSGGLRQRAMIAIALACDPRILIADEPTTALDVTMQGQILELLQKLQAERGMAVMLITHNMGVVAETCDEVAVMYLGRVVERGPVDDIFHTPRHPYTKALLSSIPSVLAKPRTRLPTLLGSIPHPYSRPKGCPFHTRCPAFMPETCDIREPAMAPVEAQDVRCFLYPGA
jgi:peptide/nickel transport system ATP-binding protein